MPKDFDETKLMDTVEEINRSFETFKEKHDGFLLETQKGFEDVVRKEEVEKINSHIEEQQKTLDEISARQKRLLQNEAKSDEDSELEQKAQIWAKMNSRRIEKPVPADFGLDQVKQYREAFKNFLLVGDVRHMESDEVKALSVGRDPDGGYLVLPDTSGRIIDRIFETSPVRQYANVQTIGTDALEGMHDVDEASAGWVGERASRPSTDTPELDVWRIPVHELYAKPEATQKLIDDATMDMEAWLATKVADKMGRVEATAFVSGDGQSKPRGFLTYPDYTTAGTFQLGAIEQFDTGVSGDFAADPDGGDILLDALYGLKQQYRNNANWFMNRGTTKEVRKLKDSDGVYMWQPGLQAGQPATLLGYGVVAFEDMPDLAADSLSIAVGDMNATYQIVERQGIRVLVDPYSNKPFVQYYTTRRVGGDVVNFESLKLIKFAS